MKPITPFLLAALAWGSCQAQSPLASPRSVEEPSAPPLAQLTESGQILVGGQMTHYLIRHLPVSSFPALPAAIQSQLDLRGCLIPQTYEARRPENVVRASLERQGSSDWTVLCSAKGTVSLLVFFGGDPGHPFTLASAPETERLQSHDRSGVLGFNWGIDPHRPSRCVRPRQAWNTDRRCLTTTPLPIRWWITTPSTTFI